MAKANKQPARVLADLTATVRMQHSDVFFDDLDAAMACTSNKGRKGKLEWLDHAQALIANNGKGYFIIPGAVKTATARTQIRKLSQHYDGQYAFTGRVLNAPDPVNNRWQIGDLLVTCQAIN